MKDIEPVHLNEDVNTGSHFLIYGTENGVHAEIQYLGDALWMTQAQMSELFGRDVSVISRHIASILDEGELDENHLQKMQMNPRGGPSTLYSLDMVISVGYRVSSKQATLFRKWATDKLVQFATKGFVVDSARLKQPESRDRVAELKEVIRDIRSDEANVYRELRQICAMCQDYDGQSDIWRNFYKTTQAKLVYAVTTNTPAEVIYDRADASIENMGLTNWQHDNLRKSDVAVSKNYLAEREIKELNRLTTILLDIFEDQLDLGRIQTMSEIEALLNKQLTDLGRSVLRHGGRRSMKDAQTRAEQQYKKYNAEQKRIRQEQADAAIIAIRNEQKNLRSRSPRKK